MLLGNFLIGLREGLEASLVISILVAYLVKSGRREDLRWIWAGVGIAVAVSLGFGFILTYGPKGLTFEAQEFIGGTLSLIAVGFVTWMVLWMASASREMSSQLRGQLDEARKPGALVLISLLAVGREGLETALFIWAASRAAARDTGATSVPLLGALAGIAVAVVLGYLLYRGAIRLNLGTFFRWTGAFLVFIAAGVLAYGIHDLQEARFLPGLNNHAFDVSQQIPADSLLGSLLKGIFNFTPAPTVAETIAWVIYVAVVGTLFWRRSRPAAPRLAPARELVTAGETA